MRRQTEERHDHATATAGAFRTLCDQSRVADLLHRYETCYHRQYARALNLLLDWKFSKRTQQTQCDQAFNEINEPTENPVRTHTEPTRNPECHSECPQTDRRSIGLPTVPAGLAPPPAASLNAKITRVIEGYLDSLADGYVQGWARDTRKPLEPATVTVHCDGRPVGTTAADIYRADLKQAGYGEGKHGFAFYLPDGLEGDLTVWVNGTQLPGGFQAPHLLSQVGPHQRSLLAKNYLHGEGIEIGALDSPLRPPPGVKIRTVDRLPTEELRAHYGFPKAVPVDYVCDAQTLEGIASESQDFVIANHVFEHMENPVGALENWVRVLRPGGFVFMAIPDKRYTFDVDRAITPLAHILEEYRDPEKLAANRLGHFEEWVRQVEHETSGVEERIAFLMHISYSIHFHCWTGKELCELFESVSWIGFELDCYKSNRPENIFLLRKLGGSNSPASGILGSKVTGFLRQSFARAKLQRLTGLARRVYGRTPR